MQKQSLQAKEGTYPQFLLYKYGERVSDDK